MTCIGTTLIGACNMDFFRFLNTADGYLSQGKMLNGIRTATWIERFRDPGEFTINAPVSSQLRTELPIGSFISHIDTLEVMIVENHEIDEDVKESEPEIIISGRTLESYLEQRIVGDDIETYVDGLGHRLYTNIFDYVVAFDTSWAQTRTLIYDHLTNPIQLGSADDVPGFIPIANQQHIGSSTTQERIMRRQSLHSAVMELLSVDDFGLKNVRPNAGNVVPTSTEIRIHNGFDRTDAVVFSYTFGDLERSKYFWSNKSLKTDYYCTLTNVELRSNSGITGLDRRIALVDCSDMDGHLNDDDVTDGTVMTPIVDAADVRGQQVVRAQQPIAILSTDISKTTQYKFRRDYDVGDLVRVNGNYDITNVMRVTEHVEFQDERGETGYPTLALYYGEA